MFRNNRKAFSQGYFAVLKHGAKGNVISQSARHPINLEVAKKLLKSKLSFQKLNLLKFINICGVYQG